MSPQPPIDHAWRDQRTTHARLSGLPDPKPSSPGGGGLHVRIGQVLADAIEARVWRQGEKLPAAAPIANRFRTSVDTARHALRWLIANGWADRTPGGPPYSRGPKGL